MTFVFAASAFAEVSLPPQLTLKHDLQFQKDMAGARLHIEEDDVRQSSLNKIVGQCLLNLRSATGLPTGNKIAAGTVLNPSHIEYSKDFQTAFHHIGKMFTITFWAIFLPRNYQVYVMLKDDLFSTIQCNFGIDGTDNVDVDRLLSKALERNFLERIPQATP